MNSLYKYLIILPLIISVVSCSKEEDEVPLANPGVTADDFDNGYLGIRLLGSAGLVDSIRYTNLTKGVSISPNASEIAFVQGSNYGLLAKPLRNGNTGDQIRCCVYLNTATDIVITYVDDPTIPFVSAPAGKYCIDGTY